MRNPNTTPVNQPSKEDQWLSLQEVAITLQVSTATVRNWMKAGKLRKFTSGGAGLSFSRAEIQELKEEIESGASHRLKSRRNKRAVEGNFVPTEYVTREECIRLTVDILGRLSKVKVQIEPQLILFEIALRLLLDKGVIEVKPGDNTLSLTELASRKQLDLGQFGELLLELWDYKSNRDKIPQAAYQVLREVRQLKIQWTRGEDLLGLVYMALSNLGARKSKGSYYTPSKLVDDLVQQSLNSLGDVPAPKILDPCCGSGNFLIKLFMAIVERMKGPGCSQEEVEKLVLETLLYGYDIDPTAVALAKINLVLLLEGVFEHPREVTSILQSLNLHIKQKNTLANYGGLSEVTASRGYNLVIGNPPWGYSFTEGEKKAYRKNFLSAETALESFALFIEYGLSILEDEGLLAFVLPEALLNVKIHSSIRKLLLEKTEILQINVLGHQFSQVFTPTITFLARLGIEQNLERNQVQYQKLSHNQDLDRHYDRVHTVRILQGEDIYTISQKRFLENEMYIFNVKTSKQENEILKHMRALPEALFLAGNAEFALGIVTGDNKEFVFKEQREGAEPVLKGNEIFKYNYTLKDNYLMFEPEKFQQVAPVHLYSAPEKLIYRFINESLVFAYDNRQILTLNSANLVIPHLNGYSIKYVLAVLNSRAAQFFHRASFSSVKVLRKHIESLPIPPCNSSLQMEIINRVEVLINTSQQSQRIQLYEQLDKQIMQLYSLTAEQQDHIRRTFQVPQLLG